MCEICSKLTIKTQERRDVVVVFLLLILYIFHTLFWYFHYWVWTSKCRLGTSMEPVLRFSFATLSRHSFLPPIKLGGFPVFKIRTKRGVMKKLLRDRGVSWKMGGVLLERRGFPKCFISFTSEKHVFITKKMYCKIQASFHSEITHFEPTVF